jgi:hypothetical protein
MTSAVALFCFASVPQASTVSAELWFRATRGVTDLVFCLKKLAGASPPGIFSSFDSEK